MHRFILAGLFWLLSVSLWGQAHQLSESAEISIITCGPDPNELYSAFGHSAIRIIDPENGFDYAFNYGVFDFDQPNFYLNFARGKNFYKLAVYKYENFEWAYQRDGRFIHEQVLHLSPAQKEKIYNFLMWNAQPENRTYRYDYYHDNCATRIRDVLINELGSDLLIDSTFFKATHSFRQKTNEYLSTLPWGDLGIDICLGLPIDRTMYASEYMFLPDYIESFVDRMQLKSDSGSIALVKEKRIANPQTVEAWNSLVHPLVAFGVLLLLVVSISIWDWRRKKLSKWLDLFLFIPSGLVGVLLTALWLLTDHHDAAKNFNILWALPTHLIVGLILVKKQPPRWLRTYFMGAGILNLVIVAGWTLLPQAINPFLLPLIVALLVRCFLRGRTRFTV
ncbi:MAG: DUF4105 domain-containing protein [Cyclobacteriaceae bacterium]|nr:DUF4105 domain-containing protein [Cyclobacteriaceae bacterium]